MSEYKIDATNESLGRLASKIAIILRGKNKATYVPNILPKEMVYVTNASKLKLTGKKVDQKTYYRYTGYPGNVKKAIIGELMAKDPASVLKKTVYHMLPENRTRNKIIKNLIITR